MAEIARSVYGLRIAARELTMKDSGPKTDLSNSQMPIKSKHKDLFHAPTTDDKLNLFNSLLDANELTVTVTLALLKVIHEELKNNRNRDRSVYKRYAEVIETLRYHMLDMFQLVVATWNNNQSESAAPAEWFPDDKNT
jgi:hypothetical protein